MITNRLEFTVALVALLQEMFQYGERPILDYVKRSDQEQRRLFNEELSECDGVNDVSKHQRGRAADIYFINDSNDGLVTPKMGHEHWHNRWVALGGAPMISWDKGHYEGGS